MFTTLFAAFGCWKKPNIELAGGACDSNTNRQRGYWHRPGKPDLAQTVAISTLPAPSPHEVLIKLKGAFITHDARLNNANQLKECRFYCRVRKNVGVVEKSSRQVKQGN
jgi:hypothetical protein